MAMIVDLPGLGEMAISITHNSRRPLGTGDPADVSTSWHSTLVAFDDDERDHLLAVAETHIIHADRLDGWSLLDVLDEISADVASYLDLFDQDGQLVAGISDNFAGSLIVADRVSVDPQYRGHGLGPLLLAEALVELGQGCQLAVCTPAPFEEPTGYDDINGTALVDAGAAERWEHRRDELRLLWSRLGFERFEDTDIYTLDLVEPALYDALADIRQNCLGT